MKLILLRHGETNYNVKGICNSQPNPKVRLTVSGRAQAAQAAEVLKTEKIEVIITSELFRTQQTARIINKFHSVPIKRDGRLNDRNTGFENKSVEFFYKWRAAQKNPWTATPKNGESYQALKKRLSAFLKDLKKEDYKVVLVVAHLPVLAAFKGIIEGISDDITGYWTDKQVPNCKIMKFNISSNFSDKKKILTPKTKKKA